MFGFSPLDNFFFMQRPVPGSLLVSVISLRKKIMSAWWEKKKHNIICKVSDEQVKNLLLHS